ncbi:hypothetical protein HD554DRAFT_2229087 [Boletus coccyginus]|nr:hypothetical protein HD554DRAFT_2229087 [Boletus coccyginus]
MPFVPFYCVVCEHTVQSTAGSVPISDITVHSHTTVRTVPATVVLFLGCLSRQALSYPSSASLHHASEWLLSREWMALHRLVLEDLSVPRGGFGDIPSSREKSLQPLLPVNGGVATASLVDRDIASGSIPSEDAQRRNFVIEVLQSMEHPLVAWSIFDPDINILPVYCASHRVVVPQGGHYAGCGISSLPEARLSTELLSMVARAVGLVASGAGIQRSKLISMLEDFRSCSVSKSGEIGAETLFGSFERLDRSSLLSLGFAHGLVPTGGRDDMRDTLMLHLTNGAAVLKIRILDVGSFIKMLPLKRLLRLHDVTFEPSSKLAKLQKTLRTYVGRLKLLQESYSADALQTEWPSVVLDQ